LGALTKKRIAPVVEIEPLKLVPPGKTYCSCDAEDERVKVGTVAANAEEAINKVNSRAAKVAERNNLVLFMTTHQMLREVKSAPNNNHV
jgi:hypothetical protein